MPSLPTQISDGVTISDREIQNARRRQPRLTLRRRLSNISEGGSIITNRQPIVASSPIASLRPRFVRNQRSSRMANNAQQPPTENTSTNRSRSQPHTTGIDHRRPSMGRHRAMAQAPLPPDPRESRNYVVFESETEGDTSSCLSTTTQATSVFSDVASNKAQVDEDMYQSLGQEQQTRRHRRSMTVGNGTEIRERYEEPRARSSSRHPAPPTVTASGIESHMDGRSQVRERESERQKRGGQDNKLHIEVLAAQAKLKELRNKQTVEEALLDKMELIKLEKLELQQQQGDLTKELEDTVSELSTLKSQSEKSRMERAAERKEIEALRKELDEQAHCIANLNKELAARDALQTQNTELREQLAQQSTMLDELRASLEERDRQLVEAQNERGLYRDAKEAFEARADDLEKEVIAVREGRKDHEALLIAQVADLELTRDALQARADNMEGEMKARGEDIAKLTVERDSLRQDTTEKDAEIVVLKDSNTKLEEDKNGLETKLTEVEAENGDLKSRVDALEVEKKELEAKLEAAEAEKAGLHERVKELEAEKESLQTDKTAAQAEIDKWTSVRDDLQGEVEALKADITANQAAIAKLQEDSAGPSVSPGAPPTEEEEPADEPPSAPVEDVTSEDDPVQENTEETEDIAEKEAAEPPAEDNKEEAIAAEEESEPQEPETTDDTSPSEDDAIAAAAATAAAAAAEAAAGSITVSSFSPFESEVSVYARLNPTP